MPHKPKRPCSYPGCPELTDGRYCAKHQALMNKQYDDRYRDKGARDFYSSAAWRNKRKEYLTEHPFCEECRKSGILAPAQMVDHIKPIKHGGALLDDNNLQALCNRCHSRKSIEEGSRYGNR